MTRNPVRRALSRALPFVALLAGFDAAAARPADDLLVVDCLLPGQLRQLAHNTTYLSARRPVKTTAQDCRVRSGEYVVQDLADYHTALKVWLEVAQAGDAEAQTTVGEIFEKGMGLTPDFETAALWYRRAADAGYARAQINLGSLYERGLGVAQDSATALGWYRRAAGANSTIALDSNAEPARDDAAARQYAGLRTRANDLEREIATLRAENDTARTQLQMATDAATQARTDAAQQANAASATNAALAAAKAEGDLRAQQLTATQQLLAERETTIAERTREVQTLQAQLAELGRRRAVPAVRESDIASRILAGPEISIIEPDLPLTRGLVKVSVPTESLQRRVVGRVVAPAGLISLAVNEAPATPNEAGVFVSELTLQGEESRVQVTAIDRQGKRADLSFFFTPNARHLTAVAPDDAARHIEFGTYHALLIGNVDYQFLPDLQTPGNDVDDLERVLRTRFGFETRVLRNATRYEILSAFNDLRATLSSDDNLLVYYAGHGELDEANMRGHWLPVDAEPDSSANWISNVTITDILNVVKAKQILLVVDSCYSGTLTRSAIVDQQTAPTASERLTWLRLMATKRARVVLSSGGLAPVLDAGGGRHSVFAKALLDVLDNTADVIEGQALYRAVAARVAHAAAAYEFEQMPQYAPIAHAGHEAGDFFLLPNSR